jgi:LCP family protein required for cell wall assembly
MRREPPEHTARSHGSTVRILLAVAATLSLLTAAGSAYGYYAYNGAQRSISTIPIVHIPGSAAGQEGQDFGPCVDDICNYLILGSDSREGLSHDELVANGTDQQIGGENRSDTIMLVHTDPSQERAVILSFPRDLWVNIPGHGYDKINAAFEGGLEHGGPQLVARTVQDLTGLKINHVLYVNLAGFEGIVEAIHGVYMCIPSDMQDPLTQLDLQAGCQTLSAQQALGYVRTRHQPCDYIPDFSRIGRQQQFLRSVLNKILSPSSIVQAPSLVRPVAKNLVTDPGFDLADIVYLVKQLQGMTNGTADFRAVPGTATTIVPPGWTGELSVVKMDPAAEQIFKAIRDGKPLGNVGIELQNTATSEANIAVPVVDHESAGKATGVEDVLSASGFDITPGVVTYATFGADVKGSVIAYEPGHEVQAQVVGKYFPGVKLVQTKAGALSGADVAIFVTSSYEPQEPGSGPSTPTCIVP